MSFRRYVGITFLLGIYLFAVLGLQSFRGFMYSCNDPSVQDASGCIGHFLLVNESCSLLPTEAAQRACRLSETGVEFPRLWTAVPENFDSIGNALLTVFEIMTGAMPL